MYRGHATGGALIYLRGGGVSFFFFPSDTKEQKERKKEGMEAFVGC